MPAGADLPRLTDPSKVAIGTFTSPEAFLASQCSLGTRVIDAPAPDFRGKMTRIDLDRTRVRVGEATHPLSSVTTIAHCRAFVMATRPAPPRRLSGHAVPDGTIFQPRPNDLLIGSSPSGKPWPWTTITVGYATFEHDLTALAARTVAPSPIDAATVRVPDRARHRLLGLVADAARLATTRPEIAEVPAAACALSGAILEALVECLAQGELATDRAAVRRHYRIMHRLELLLRDRVEDVTSSPTFAPQSASAPGHCSSSARNSLVLASCSMCELTA